MTEFLTVGGGTIAYEVDGDGPLVVLTHGMGDSREAYRFVGPRLVAAGYRVALADMRGCGESSAQWPSYTAPDVAGDLLTVTRHLGGPAVLVGHSFSGGAVTLAAVQAPDLVTGIIELAPFTRKMAIKPGDLRVKAYRQGAYRLIGAGLLGSVPLWLRYLDHAYPGRKPADWTARMGRTGAMMREPGRMRAMQKMGRAGQAESGARLGDVRCPALIVEGSLDPDWADPRAEGEAIVAAMPAGRARLEIIDGAGHYPHAQFPDQVVSVILTFLRANARA